MTGFRLEALLEGRYREWLVQGFVTTVELSVLVFTIALMLGIVVATMRISSSRVNRWVAAAYIEYHRNTPALVQLFFWYFAIAERLPKALKDAANAHNGEFIFATIALALCTSAYIAEDIRSGIRAIPVYQQEAARAIGFSHLQALAHVILPQALRIATPAVVSRFLLATKNSSLAMAVGVGEMIYQARQIESITFRAFEAFGAVTVGYLALTLSLMALGRWYERRLQHALGGR